MATASSNSEAKGPKVNRLGFPQGEYRGAASTLCAGCGHDSITSQITKACWEMGIEPTNFAKMSGIGCSSKTTAYFLGQSHGYNGVHGRMAATATGSHLANRKLVHVGVSGDGDTAAIGMSHFLYMIRRNVPILYIIENNGVYGLTKGQISATADKGSVTRDGQVIQQEPIDCCTLAITMGAGFVARSFSGDFSQLCTLIKAGIAHRGTAIIDVISPCMSFNNHEGSTKSQAYVKAHQDPLHELEFIPRVEGLAVDYAPGRAKLIEMPDGSYLVLKKLEKDYDPTDKMAALCLLEKARREGQILTGLVYHGPSINKPLDEELNLINEPLATLPEERVRPRAAALKQIMAGWR